MEIKRPTDMRGGQKAPYAKGTAVTGAKGFVFLSGVTGRDPETGIPVEGIRAQTRIVWGSIKRKLEELGTSLENICHIRFDVVGQFGEGQEALQVGEGQEALQEFWKEHCPQFIEEPPSMTGVRVAGLVLPEMLIEITVTAAIP